MEELFYTVQEVAKMLKVRNGTVLSMIHKGKLKAIRIGRLWRIKKYELERMIQNDNPDILQEYRKGV